MELRISINDQEAKDVTEKADAVGLTLEQVVQSYLHRIAEGSEPLYDELLPDGSYKRRTLREQTYRLW